MWTPEGRTKSAHNSEVSTLVKLGVATIGNNYIGKTNGPGKKCPWWWGVHKGGVSTERGSTVCDFRK